MFTGMAESLLQNQPELFTLPLGLINLDDIEKRRLAESAEDHLRPNNLFL